jgi:hypothetical protein
LQISIMQTNAVFALYSYSICISAI